MKESKLFKSIMATLIVLVGPAVALASTSDYFEEAAEATVTGIFLESTHETKNLGLLSFS